MLDSHMEDKIFENVIKEIKEASTEFPLWPREIFHALSIINEEIGELNKEVLDTVYKRGGKYQNIWNEAIQSIAMLVRFLGNFDEYHFKQSETFDDTTGY